MNTQIRPWTTWTGTLVAILLLAGCGGPPASNPMLEDARSAFATAASDSLIEARAPVALQEAEEDLQRSEQLFRSGADPDEVTHYAYLAQQRIRIAEETARLKEAEASVQRAEAERREVQLEARTVEARRAEQQAQAAQQAAQQERERAEEASSRAQELARQVQDLEAERTERGLVLTLGDVLFSTGRAELQAGAERVVERLASFMREYPERTVLVEGHTDVTGSEQLNLELSRQRAAAVRDALVQQGISRDRIRTRGYASRYPVATNDTAAGRQQNRRVEIVLSDAEGKVIFRDE